MSNGYGANHVTIIGFKSLRRMCPLEFELFFDKIIKGDVDDGTCLQSIGGNPDELKALCQDIKYFDDEQYKYQDRNQPPAVEDATDPRDLAIIAHYAFTVLAKAFQKRIDSLYRDKYGGPAQSLPELKLEYHDGDNHGDCYDDVNGLIFVVENTKKLTPEACLIADDLEDAAYVTYS